jgi:hypothetical protein
MKRHLLLAVIFSFLALHTASAQILVEAFRSIGCLNCVDADKKYEDFMNANPKYNINIVYIHNNIATFDDPFYAASKADVDARMASTVYDVSSDPVLFISGFSGGEGAIYESNWEKLSADPASAKYPGTLAASASIIGSDTLQVDLHADGSSGGVQVKAYAMLVESGIHYANSEAYGNPPGNIWNNVFRAMIPGSQGGSPFILNGPTDFHFKYASADKPWNLNNCKIYAFLQEVPGLSDNSHPIDAFSISSITQSAVSKANGLMTNSIGVPIPNPSQSFAKIPFRLAAPANVKIVICDDLGREVSTILNRFVSKTESSSLFYPDQITRGIYYARMYADGAYVGTQKIVFAP